MKKRLIIIAFCFLFILQIRSAAASEPSAPPIKIAVASDLHLDPEHQYPAVINPLTDYDMEIVDALLWDVQNQGADVLLLCGDVTNGGRIVQHQALADKLASAEKNGLKIYVLPGNHDIREVTAEQFPEYYQDFGYDEAYSLDTDSLSYSVLLDDLLILMLDTDGYSKRTDGAYLSDTTLSWIKDQLEQAKENEWLVLPTGHYALLALQTTVFTGKEALLDLFQLYHVPLYLCGHLHLRNVASINHLTELVVEQAISYPCNYALLELNGKYEYKYHPQKINVSAWAKQQTDISPEFVRFDALQEQLFLETCQNTILTLKRDQSISNEDLQQATDFYWQMQNYYASGTLFEHKEMLLSHPGYQIFMQMADGTSYQKWIPVFIENTVPYTAGFSLTQTDEGICLSAFK